MEPRVPYMLKHSYQWSHIFITNLLVCVMKYWGTLELCSVVREACGLQGPSGQWLRQWTDPPTTRNDGLT